jgi:hypothetical protein
VLRIKELTMLCMAGLSASAGAASQGDEKLFVQVPAIYDSQAQVPPAVWHECDLGRHIGEQVLQRVSERFRGALPLDSTLGPGQEKTLKLTIVGVRGLGGGAWSGAKTILLRADLQQDGREIAMTVVDRSSKGGPLGGVSGTCPIMERISVALGRDVAAWLPRVIGASPDTAAAPATSPGAPSK